MNYNTKIIISSCSILVLLLCVVLYTQTNWFHSGNSYMLTGFAYKSGIISINTNKIQSYEEYKAISDHEWGHIEWRRLNRSEKLKFKKFILQQKCTTDYTCSIEALYGRGNTFVEEEYAENFRISKSIYIDTTYNIV